jgi:outer membrane protein assembly complex protein YaeT
VRLRRIAAGILLALAAPLLLAAWLLRSGGWVEGRIRDTLQERATALAGGKVAIGRVRLRLLPLSLTLRDVTLERRGNRGSEAAAGAAAIEARAGLLTVLGVRRGPVSVSVAHPRVRILLAEGRPIAAGGGEGLLPADTFEWIPPGSRLVVTGASFEVERPATGLLRLEEARLEVAPLPGVPALHGSFEFASGSWEGPAGSFRRLAGGATFRLTREEARFEGLHVRGPGLSGGGRLALTAGAAPGAEGSLRLEAELPELAKLLPPESEPAGRIELTLDGTWRDGRADARGSLEGVGVRLWGVTFETLRADLEVGETIRLQAARAHLLGGEATGAIDLARRGDRHHATVDLSVDGVDIAQVLTLAGWQGPGITGTLHYRGRHELDSSGLASLRGSGILDAVGHTATRRGADLPLEVTAALTTEGEAATLKDGTIRAGSTRGAFSGVARRGEGLRLRLRGATGDISEILPLFGAPPAKRAPAGKPPAASKAEPRARGSPGAEATFAARRSPRPWDPWTRKPEAFTRSGGHQREAAADPPPPITAPPPVAPGPAAPAPAAPDPDPSAAPAPAAETPLERIVHALGGRWEWQGDLHVGSQGMTFQGGVKGTDLTLGGTPLGTLEASIAYAGDTLRIEAASLRIPEGGGITVGGSVDFRGEGSLALEAQAEDYPLAPLLSVAAIRLPVDGLWSGRVLLGGRPDAPTGRATLRVEPVRVGGVAVDSLEGELLFTPDLLETERFILSQGPGVLTLRGRLPYEPGEWLARDGEGPPAVVLDGSGLDLSSWSGLAGGVALQGTAAVKGEVRGSIRSPEGEIGVRVEGLRAGTVLLGETRIDLRFTPGTIAVTGGVPERRLRLDGGIDLEPGAPIELRLALDDSVIEGREILPLAPEEGRLVLSGSVVLRGPAGRPRELEARAELHTVAVEAVGLELRADGPVVARLAAGTIELAPVSLRGTGTEVTLSAAFDPAAGGPLRAEATGAFDLKLLRLLDHDLQADGRCELVVRLTGSRSAPEWQGTLRVDADGIRHPRLPSPVSEVAGRAVFENAALRIESLSFLAGGGRVEGDGVIRLGPQGPANGASGPVPLLRVRDAAVRFRGSGVRAEFPEGFRSVADLEVTLTRDEAGPRLKGWIEIVRGIYGRDFRLEEGAAGKRAADLFPVMPAAGPFGALNLDLEVRAPGDLWLRNDLGSVEGQGEIRITGTAARPSITGRVTAVEGGTITFRKIRYRVQNGTIDFADPLQVRPIFDLSAETRVADVQVTLRLEGSLDDFRYELTSEPPMPQQDLIALLLTGRTFTGADPAGIAGEETVSAYLADRLTGEITERLSGRAGLDLLYIDPLQVNAHGDPTARVTLGKQVTQDLFVTYSTELGSNQGAVYQLDYSLARDVSFTSQRDADGSIGGDFKFIVRGAPPAVPGADPRPARPVRLAAVRLDGELGFPERRIARKLRLRPGRRRDRGEIGAGVERLLGFYRERGYLMAEVDDEEAPAGPDTVDLIVRVRTGPRITVLYEGDRVREGVRQEVATLWQKGLFLDDIVESIRDRLRSLLQDRGHLSAEVEAAVARESDGEARVTLRVRHGPRVRASVVRVAGARRIREKEVLGAIRTSADSLFSRGLVRRAVLEQDAGEIRDLYLERGFPAARVTGPEVTLEEDGRRARVVFTVEEGPQVSIAGVAFEGHFRFGAARLERLARLKAGAPYTAGTVEEAVLRLRRAYDEAGLPDVEIEHRPPPLTRGDPDRAVTLLFAIREGALQRVERVNIAGNALTRDDVIRKTLALKPGAPLSREQLLASQTRLYRRGIFRSVALEVGPSPGPGAGDGDSAGAGAAAGDGAVPREVTVRVREASPLTQVFGLGWDSEARTRALYEISHRNILGTGRHLGLQTRASDLEQRAVLSFREQGIFGGRFDALASTFVEDEERPAFEVRTLGSSVQLSRQLSRATRTIYRYSLRDVDLSDAAAVFEGTTLRLSSLAVSAVHDTRDALFDPRRGHYLSGEVQYSGAGLGSEADYTKMYAQIFKFKEVLPGTVWAQALRAGLVVPFGRSVDDPAATGDLASGVPPSERFFAGGDTTVRGFRRDRLGPIDVDGEPLGGEGIFLFNQELRFPIRRFLQGVVFYDAGNVFRVRGDYNLGGLRHVAGAGLRFATPIGPFRLEYGAILDREPDEPRGELFLSIGQAF